MNNTENQLEHVHIDTAGMTAALNLPPKKSGPEVRNKIQSYAEMLFEFNKDINLMSRKMTVDGLKQLIDESILLESYIDESADCVIDAGSGNGLLGIPVAILNKNKPVVLVESIQKKARFLDTMKEKLQLSNVRVFPERIEDYMTQVNRKSKCITLIARGFPDFSIFCYWVKKRKINQAVLITSENKIKKNQLHLETCSKKTYNVPSRDTLKVLTIKKPKA